MNDVQQALEILRAGGLILYPTDTVWGIGCDATNEAAVAKVYALKQRSDAKSLIVMADSMGMVERYVQQVPPMAYDLTEVSDMPLTIVYPQAVNIAANALAEDGSIAIRIVKHAFCEELLRKFKRPVISTSANISTEPTPSMFAKISEEIKNGVDFVVDASLEKGATRKPSSIIKLGVDGTVAVIRK